jgi:hypothetical protein
MAGRELCDDAEARRRGFGDAMSAQRRRVLHETLTAFEQCQTPDRYHRLAAANLARWNSSAPASESGYQRTPSRFATIGRS